MIDKTLFIFCFLSGALFGAPPRDSLAIQDLKISLQQVDYRINSHRVEIDLLQERIRNLETEITQLNGNLRKSCAQSPQESRIANLEKGQEALVSDIKKLSSYIDDATASLTKCQAKLTAIDKQITSDIQSLKSSIHSMLALLKGEDASGKTYVVKPGDSLGQIALDNKVSLKAIRELNQLHNDTIIVGQKLRLP